MDLDEVIEHRIPRAVKGTSRAVSDPKMFFEQIPDMFFVQIPGEYAGDTGKTLVLVILLLLFVGGALLLVRSVVDFMQSRKASKREKETGNRRKAA